METNKNNFFYAVTFFCLGCILTSITLSIFFGKYSTKLPTVTHTTEMTKVLKDGPTLTIFKETRIEGIAK